jgi:hypothetical protein
MPRTPHHRAATALGITVTCAAALPAIIEGATAAPAAGGDIVESVWTGAVDHSWTNALNWSPSEFFPNDWVGGNLYVAIIDADRGTDARTELDASVRLTGLIVDAGDRLELLDGATLRLRGPVVNDGIVSVQSVSGDAEILVGQPVIALEGTGELRLGGAPTDRVSGFAAGTRLTHGPDHSIRGGGTFGAETIEFDNHGTIEASDGLTLLIDPFGDTSTNRGVLGAIDGGTLIVGEGAIDNAGGVLRAAAGSEVRFEDGTIVGGDVVAEPGGIIRTVAQRIGRLVDARTLGVIEVEDGSVLELLGTHVNDGVLRTASTGSLTRIRINDEVVHLDGRGEVRLGGSDLGRDKFLSLDFDQRLVHGPSHAIRGGGDVGSDRLILENHGLLEADDTAWPLLVVSREEVLNTGILRATGGGTLRLAPPGYINTEGLIEADDASVVEIMAPVIGGDLVTTGSGRVVTNGTFEDVRSLARVEIENSRTLCIRGTLENHGEVRLLSTGSSTRIAIDTTATIAGPGEIVMGGPGGNEVRNQIIATVSGIFTLTHGADHVIRGTGNVGDRGLDLVNLGLIEADVPGEGLTVRPSTTVENPGRMRARAGATLTLLGGTVVNDGGHVTAEDGGVVVLNQCRLTGGTLSAEGDGIVRLILGDAAIADLEVNATVELENGRTLELGGTIVNHGTIRGLGPPARATLRVSTPEATLAGTGEVRLAGEPFRQVVTATETGFVLINDVAHAIRGRGDLGRDMLELVNRGRIEADDPAGPLVLDPATWLENEGLVRVAPGCRLEIRPGSFVQRGELVVEAGSRLDRTGPIVQTAGTATVDGLLMLAPDTLEVQGGRLRGAGTVGGAVMNAGTVQPGGPGDAGPATLTIDGDFQQAAAGTLIVQVGPDGRDRLYVKGTATLDGTLRVGVAPGFTPRPGTQYELITADAIAGTIALENCPAGAILETGPNHVSIRFTGTFRRGDLDCDGRVDHEDLMQLLAGWGACPDDGQPCPADLDGDRTVDLQDLLILLGDWD